MTGLRIEHVSKKFGEEEILNDINLEIDPNILMGLSGPEGSGKTTLLRILAGLETPDSGKIFMNDHEITNLSPAERNLGLVFEDFALYPHFNVYDNIASPLDAEEVSDIRKEKKIKEVAEILQISDKMDSSIDELSGGEKQRVGIARTLAKENIDFCLLDEPLSRLDYKLKEKLRSELKHLQERINIPIIYATPDPESAIAACDELAIIQNGDVKQKGAFDEIYREPADIFVAKYFGDPEINLLECTATKKTDKILLKTKEFEIEFSAKKMKNESFSDDLLLGIRPYDLRIQMENKPSSKKEEISLEVEVFASEFKGKHTEISAQFKDRTLKAIKPEVFKPESGKKIWFIFDIDDIYLFDKETGKNLKGKNQ